MRILSKYKDFYDFLSGLYGIDDKIILDRRHFSKPTYVPDKNAFCLHICGIVYEGVYTNGKFYWCKNLEPFSNKITQAWSDNRLMFDMKFGRNLYVEPYLDLKNINQKFNCPIILAEHDAREYGKYNTWMYPPLKDLNISSILPAREIYLQLIDWLSPKDIDPTPRPDKEKIVSAGFDLKTSFRHPIK